MRCGNCKRPVHIDHVTDGHPTWVHTATGLGECNKKAPFGPGAYPYEKDMETAEHIEMDHERELAPGTTGVVALHQRMHRDRKDWAHTHDSKGAVVWE